MEEVLVCEGISMTYTSGGTAQPVLNGVSVRLNRGEACLLLGPSGSGKTTLLSILGCLLTPSAGSMRIENEPVDFTSRQRLIKTRRRLIGFVFQQAQLLPFLSAEENVHIVLANGKADGRSDLATTRAIMDRLGIRHLARKKPGQLSVGERQRVSIARALAKKPAILLADEPTASLDWKNGQAAVQLLLEQARATNALLVAVSHDVRLVQMFDRVFELDNGELIET